MTADTIKGVENRTWKTHVRGGFLIHAAKGLTGAEMVSANHFAHFRCGIALDKLADATVLPRGGIVGYAEITDCVESDPSPWFMGDYGFKLTNAKPLPFLPWKGALGFFHVDLPDDYVAANLPHLKATA